MQKVHPRFNQIIMKKQLLFTAWNIAESCCNVYLNSEHVGDIIHEFGGFFGYFKPGSSLADMTIQVENRLELCMAQMQIQTDLYFANQAQKGLTEEVESFKDYTVSYIATSPETDKSNEPTSTN